MSLRAENKPKKKAETQNIVAYVTVPSYITQINNQLQDLSLDDVPSAKSEPEAPQDITLP
jgi:hypothetical protein